jgi:hypothetical protein
MGLLCTMHRAVMFTGISGSPGAAVGRAHFRLTSNTTIG